MQTAHSLSDQELESRLKTLVQRERQLLHVILEHIRELDTRKLYLERAYSSLYEYLTKELGYSGSAAMRRIEAARLLKEVPVLAEKIQAGTLNLSQIGELSRAIKEKEKTTSETQKEIAAALDIPIKDFEKQKIQKDESVRLELTLSKEQYKKLLECRDLVAHLSNQNHKDASWASVLEALANQYLAKKKITTASVAHRNNKTLTSKTRNTIMQRDSCCQFKDPKTGRQCRSTYALQIDHRIPQWAGGRHAPENLQILCANHNRHKYHKEINLKFKAL